jgi:hypothetical protein
MPRKVKGYHERLVSEAKEALDELFADKDVEPEVTYDDLNDLRNDIDFMLNSLLKTIHDE